MLAERMGLDDKPQIVERLEGNELQLGSEVLFKRAFQIAPSEPESGTALLGMAIYAKGQETKDGRLKACLILLGRLVAQADPQKTLGPQGESTRDLLFPTGWMDMTSSWPRLRYAWREGLVDLLDPKDTEKPLVDALDELTRMHPNEVEPVPVTIQETWPSPGVTFGISILGLAISIRAMVSDWKKGSR